MHNFNTPLTDHNTYSQWKQVTTYLMLFGMTLILLVHAKQLIAYMQYCQKDQHLTTTKKQINQNEVTIANTAELLKEKRFQWVTLQNICPHSCCGPALFETIDALGNCIIKSANASRQGSAIEIQISKEQLSELEKRIEETPLFASIKQMHLDHEHDQDMISITITCKPRKEGHNL